MWVIKGNAVKLAIHTEVDSVKHDRKPAKRTDG
jgi:hypothetical protein